MAQKEGGIRINLIPRDGGNTFSGRLFTNFANHAMQGNNFTQDLRDRGLRTPNTVNKLWEFNPSFGGPIKRDRLWFYWSMRHAGAFQNVPMFFNKNAGDATKWTYEPDTNRPVADKNTTRNFTTLRVTWQATPKNKLAVTADPSDNCDCPRGSSATVAPEANAGNYVISSPKSSLHGEWTAPITNRLLLEAGLLRHWSFTARPHVNPNLPPGTVDMIAVQEQSTGLRYRATADAHEARGDTYFGLATLSYITGSLGRPLAGGERNVTVSIVEPRTMYGERRNQVDLRVGKILRFGRTTATPTFDLYNALNTNPVIGLSNAFATWQRPDDILQARFVKVGLQLGF